MPNLSIGRAPWTVNNSISIIVRVANSPRVDSVLSFRSNEGKLTKRNVRVTRNSQGIYQQQTKQACNNRSFLTDNDENISLGSPLGAKAPETRPSRSRVPSSLL